MSGFTTKNSTYYVDSQRKLITGGKLGGAFKVFTDAKIIVGMPAIIIFADGSIMRTGTVLSYI